MNKPYTLDQVLALPDGAEVWVEPKPGWGYGKIHTKRDCSPRYPVALVTENGEYWGVDTQIPETALGHIYRVWPTRPTDAEREAVGWES